MSDEGPASEGHCQLCGRKAQSEFLCEYHQRALGNLRTAFGDWQHAMTIDWDTYLDKLEKTDEVGDWVLEIIDFINSQNGPSEWTRPPT